MKEGGGGWEEGEGEGCRCEPFEAILYGAYYIILLPKPHDNTPAAHLRIYTTYRLSFYLSAR